MLEVFIAKQFQWSFAETDKAAEQFPCGPSHSKDPNWENARARWRAHTLVILALCLYLPCFVYVRYGILGATLASLASIAILIAFTTVGINEGLRTKFLWGA